MDVGGNESSGKADLLYGVGSELEDWLKKRDAGHTGASYIPLILPCLRARRVFPTSAPTASAHAPLFAYLRPTCGGRREQEPVAEHYGARHRRWGWNLVEVRHRERMVDRVQQRVAMLAVTSMSGGPVRTM